MARRWVPDSSPMGGHWSYNEVPGDQGYGEGLGTAPGGTGAGGGTVLPGGTVTAGGGQVIGGILLPPQPISPFDWTILFPQLAGSPPPKSTNGMAATIGSVQAAKPGNVVPIVYGTQRVEGQLIYSEAHAAASANFAYVVCSGPISAIRKVFINGHEIPSSVAYITYDYHLSGGVYGAYTQSQDSWMVASQFSGVGPTVSRFPGVVVARVFIQAPLAGMTWSDAVPDGPNISSVAFEVDGLVVTELRENRVPSSNDFRSAAGWASTYTPPTVTTGLSDPFGGTSAMQLAFGAAGPNDWYLDVAGNSTTAGTVTRAAMWVRVASGTVDAIVRCRKTGGTGTEEGGGHAVTVTTTWTRVTRERTTTGDGTGLGLKFYIAAGTPTIEVFCAQIDTLTTDRGSMATAGTAILVNTVRFTSNWAPCFYHFATDSVLGCGASTTYVDPDNFGNAAALCEQYGFAMNLVLANEATASRWIEAMRPLACAELYFEDGYYRVWIDTPQSTLAATFISGRTDGLPIGTWNAREVQYDAIASSDQPTRVIIEFPNAAKNYERDTTLVEVSGVSEGTTELREARYVLDGCTSETQAQRLATYIANQANAALRVTFISSFIGITLARGSLIALSSGEGLAAQQFLVEDKERAPSGVYSLRCRQYSAASYNPSVVVGDAAVTSSLPDPFTAVEPPAIGNALGYYYGASGPTRQYAPIDFSHYIFWDAPRQYATPTLYTSGWTRRAGAGAWDATKMNDGNTAVTASYLAGGGVTEITLDAGAAVRFGRLNLTGTNLGSADVEVLGLATNDALLVPDISDNWIPANGGAGVEAGTAYKLTATGSTTCVREFTDVGADYRYWRIRLNVVNTGSITEAQFLEIANESSLVDRYEISRVTSAVDGSVITEQLGPPIPASRRPTISNPLDMGAYVVALPSSADPQSAQFDLWIAITTIMRSGAGASTVRFYESKYTGWSAGSIAGVVAEAASVATLVQRGRSLWLENEIRSGTALTAGTHVAIKDASPAVSGASELRLKSASGVLQVSVHGAAYAAPAPGAHASTHGGAGSDPLGQVVLADGSSCDGDFTAAAILTADITTSGGAAPTSSTAAADTDTTQLATTAFVLGQASDATPAMDGTGAAGTSERYARQGHVHPTDTSRAPTASPTFTGPITAGGVLLCGTTLVLDDNVAANICTIALGSGEMVAGELHCYVSSSRSSGRQVAQRLLTFRAYEVGGAITVQLGTTDLGNLLSGGTLGVTFGSSATASTFTLTVTADTDQAVGMTMSMPWTLIIPRAVTVT